METRVNPWLLEHVPGLVVAGLVAFAGFAVSWRWTTISPLTASLLGGVLLGNATQVPMWCDHGLKFSARQILRVGIVLLGLQLSFRQVADLGGRGLVAVIIVVTTTFFGTQFIARWLGVSRGLGLLTATGYSICGVSAISAMVGATDGSEQDATYAITLVTIFGSISIFVLPVLGHFLHLGDVRFGMWAGSAVHDVAQVVATSTAYSHESLSPAVVVKLTRVLLLAPIVASVAFAHRNRTTNTGSTVSLAPLPLFIVLFLVMVAIRSTGALSDDALSFFQHVEKACLALALVGLGAGVRFRHMRALGPRPVVLGVLSWLLVMMIAYISVHLMPIPS
ncbi:MAG: putative sulfate exporter family transporter [Ilumatobacteraceae bacterium]|nr:putative sulfate exporter family transporter [Ilumatobacteraceae bacterium]